MDREARLKQGVGRHTSAGLLFTQEEIAQLTKTFVDLYKSRQDKIADDKFQSHALRAQRTMPEEMISKPQLT